MSLSTMRVSHQTVFYGKTDMEVPSRPQILHRFPGQYRKLDGRVRMPKMALVDSSAGPNSGKGIEVREDVRAGQILSIYARNIISESTAQILKDEVCESV